MKTLFMSSVAALALCMGGPLAIAQNASPPVANEKVQTDTPSEKKAAPKTESKDVANPVKPVAGASEKETDKKDPRASKDPALSKTTSEKAEPSKSPSESKEPVTKSTSTPSPNKSAPKASTESKEPAKSVATPAAKAGASSPPSTTTETKQSPSPANPAPAASTTTAPAGNAASSTATTPATGTKEGTAKSDTATATSAPKAAAVPPEQATKINEVIARENVKPVENVNFSLSVGVNIPSTVTVHPLPSAIVEVVPQYRGYDYIVVRDEVVILEPRTRKVVTVIQRGGGSASVSTNRRFTLAPERRKVIRQTLVKSTQPRPAQTSSVRLTVGTEVPQSYEIREFPADVLQESPELREYEYVVEEDNVIVVDRRDRRVIEILD